MQWTPASHAFQKLEGECKQSSGAAPLQSTPARLLTAPVVKRHASVQYKP